MFTTKFTSKKSNLNKGYLEGANLERTELEAMESEILKHLYEMGMLDINGGWEKQSKLDKNTIDELYHAKLVDKNVSQGLVRLSERGVGAVLFGLQSADKISDLLGEELIEGKVRLGTPDTVLQLAVKAINKSLNLIVFSDSAGYILKWHIISSNVIGFKWW